MADRATGYLGLAYLALCLLLGGASAAGALANGLLQLLAVLLIVMVMWTRRELPLSGDARGLVWIVGFFVLLCLASLIPLPPAWWSQLPGRAPVVHGFSILGMPLPQLPVSLAPQGTIASLLSVLPPAAIFLLALHSHNSERRRLAWLVVAIAVVSIVLGAFQLFGGTGSPLRFYEITNADSPVGFFANTNHLATLVLCALPFAAVLAARSVSGRSAGRARRSSGMITSVAVAAFLAVGIGIIGSLAGYGLFFPAAMGSLLVYKRASMGRVPTKWLVALGGVFVMFLALALAGPLNEQALSKKLDANPSSRRVIAERTIDAAKDFMPFGSGLATFQNIYRTYDDPNRADREYVNHAHNDYVEVALELGAPGLLLILLFLAWWGRRTLRAWRGDFEGASLARAGSVAIGVVLLHSLVDYPIRTAAIAALFAVACAFLVPYVAPRARAEPADSADGGGGLRHLEAD